MTTNYNLTDGVIIGDDEEFSLEELSNVCAVESEWIVTLVEEGILEPLDISSNHWRFSSICLRRIQVIQRLQRDLDVNLAGAALALQLLNEIDNLRNRLSALEFKNSEF